MKKEYKMIGLEASIHNRLDRLRKQYARYKGVNISWPQFVFDLIKYLKRVGVEIIDNNVK